MKIVTTNVYVGPNLYAHFPVIRHVLDLGELEAWPSDRLEGFNDRLVKWLPALVEHQCGVGERGGSQGLQGLVAEASERREVTPAIGRDLRLREALLVLVEQRLVATNGGQLQRNTGE